MSALTGLPAGKELGDFMKYLHMKDQDLGMQLLFSNKDDIINMIYNRYKNEKCWLEYDMLKDLPFILFVGFLWFLFVHSIGGIFESFGVLKDRDSFELSLFGLIISTVGFIVIRKNVNNE